MRYGFINIDVVGAPGIGKTTTATALSIAIKTPDIKAYRDSSHYFSGIVSSIKKGIEPRFSYEDISKICIEKFFDECNNQEIVVNLDKLHKEFNIKEGTKESKNIILSYFLALGRSYVFKDRINANEEQMHTVSDGGFLVQLPYQGRVNTHEYNRILKLAREFDSPFPDITIFLDSQTYNGNKRRIKEVQENGQPGNFSSGKEEKIATFYKKAVRFAKKKKVTGKLIRINNDGEPTYDYQTQMRQFLPAWQRILKELHESSRRDEFPLEFRSDADSLEFLLKNEEKIRKAQEKGIDKINVTYP